MTCQSRHLDKNEERRSIMPIPLPRISQICVNVFIVDRFSNFCKSMSEPLCFCIQQAVHLSRHLVVGTQLTANLGAGQDVLAVLVELELGDDHVGGVDAQGNGLARSLVAGDTLDVDDVFQTVDGGDLALAALVGSTNNRDLVVLADGDAAHLEGLLITTRLNNFSSTVWIAGDERCTSHAAPC